MNLHAKMINLPCAPVTGIGESMHAVAGYKQGHKAARHAAAELALKADARIAHLEGQRDVLVGLLGEALPVLTMLDPESAEEGELLRDWCEKVTAALAAISAEKAGEV